MLPLVILGAIAWPLARARQEQPPKTSHLELRASNFFPILAIVIALFDGKTPEDIQKIDAEELFSRLDLRSHLTTQRYNGPPALVDRIKARERGL